MNKVRVSAWVFSVSVAIGVMLTLPVQMLPNPFFNPLDGGPLDYRPRLVSSATSPDGSLTVEVFRQRDPSYSLYVGAVMHARVYDGQNRLVYEKLIGSDGAWNELDDAFEEIVFEGDHIRISQLWGRSHVIKQSELNR
jgi:hypothetical protein